MKKWILTLLFLSFFIIVGFINSDTLLGEKLTEKNLNILDTAKIIQDESELGQLNYKELAERNFTGTMEVTIGHQDGDSRGRI